MPSPIRLFRPRRPSNERLVWARDLRFVNRLARTVADGRLIELDSGACLIAPAEALTDALVGEAARSTGDPEYGLVAVDAGLPERDRYLVAFTEAVRVSGLADRIGMAQSTQIVQTKTLDYFFNLRNNHEIVFQPIVALDSGRLHEYECLFRPVMPMLPQTVGAIVQAAIATDRSVELDTFIVGRVLDRIRDLGPDRITGGESRLRIAINLTPATLLDPSFQAVALAERVRAAGLTPRQVTLECTEQQAVSDVVPLKRQVKALRRLGFGFAVDDAGAGYASFTLIAALRPSVIKIDREIVAGIHRDDAKQALVEAFVSFGRRIGAKLLAEGIETRRDLATLVELRVDFGQGFLLGRPEPVPTPPRAIDRLLRPRGASHRPAGRVPDVPPAIAPAVAARAD
ncbi:MAG TPA: EAL domain-containing protein [Candidatus Limnocylindrales bacterium]|nr:EAL domain-containing protein [Candidatus Limnocylindrales bacterium]